MGGLSKTYGSDVLLGIAREIKRRKLTLPLILTDRFSDGREKASFQECIEQERLDIRVLPRVPADQLASYAAQACIGLAVEQPTPERLLALPTKLFEYMAYGLPVVASDLPLTREILQTAKCGILVSPAEPSAYVDAMESILQDHAKRSAMIESGFNAIEQHYSWDKEKNALISFFESFLNTSE